MKTAKTWIVNTLIAFDEFVNCACFGGAPSETISGRAARARNDGKRWGRTLCAFLDWLQPGHSAAALVNDTIGRHAEAIDLE